MKTRESHNDQRGYSPGHPWFYKLGGIVRTPKQILAAVKSSGYQGYRLDEIQQADNKPEPQRSDALRVLRQDVLKRFTSDLSYYRELACELRDYRAIDEAERPALPICSDIHTSMSLKYNHLYNGFAHLVLIDDLLSQQPDLFGF